MGLMEQAQADAQRIVTDLTGFGSSMKFTAPSGQIANVVGLHRKIHMSMDELGHWVNSRKAYVNVSEKSLTDLGYPTRNVKGEAVMIGHLVDVKDSTGTLVRYKVQEQYPDERLGLLVCILGSYQ